MSTIDPAAFERLGLSGSAQTPARPNDRLAQEQFLELMLAQLKNQDPLKPLQSGEFLSQIAQFNAAVGIQDLQASFERVAGALYSNQALQASALVGREVVVPTDRAVLAGGGLEASVELAGPGDVTVGIYDAAGFLVRRLELGHRPAGRTAFVWDGRAGDGSAAAPGVYGIRAEVRQYGEVVNAPVYATARVDSVSLGGQGQAITLNLDTLAQADFSSVIEIR